MTDSDRRSDYAPGDTGDTGDTGDIAVFEAEMERLFPATLDATVAAELRRGLEIQLAIASRVVRPASRNSAALATRRDRSTRLAWAAALVLLATTVAGWSLWLRSPDDGSTPAGEAGLGEVWVSRVRDGGEARVDAAAAGNIDAAAAGNIVSAGDIVKLHFSVERDALGFALAVDARLGVHALSAGMREVGTPTELFAFELDGFDDGPLAILLVTTMAFRSSAQVVDEVREIARTRLSSEHAFEENIATLIEMLEAAGEREVRSTCLEFRNRP